MRLLISDSDPSVLVSCRRYFSELGYESVAPDGLQCLATLGQSAPNILVLDRELLWGGGDGVLDCLRDCRSLCPKSVILTSGEFAPNQPSPADVELLVGATLRKPSSPVTLLRAIRQTRVAGSPRPRKLHAPSPSIPAASLSKPLMNRHVRPA